MVTKGEVVKLILSFCGALLFFLLGVVPSLLFKSQLPDPFPISWWIDGNPNGYIARNYGVFLLPLIGFLISILSLTLTSFDKPPIEHSISSSIAILVACLLPSANSSTFQLLILETNIKDGGIFSVDKIFIPSGLLLTVAGAILKWVEPNRYVGIRNRWTKESLVVWTKTHHLAGVLFIVSGICLLLLDRFLSPGPLAFFILFFFLGGPAVASTVYSYLIREKRYYSAADWDVLTNATPLLE